MRRSRIAWAILALCAISPGARATKLDKSACNLLNAELAGMVATGIRDDMERGPAWAKANLSAERLSKIRRLIELEEQLEFRCGMRRKQIVAIKAHAPTGSEGKIAVPEAPEKKPAETHAIKPRQDAKASAPKASAPKASAPRASAPHEAPTPQTAAAGSTTSPPAKRAAAPQSVATTTAQPRAPASPAKPSRRRGSAAYVSPKEVNPFFVTRYGDTQ
jgi:hypothetical protein